MRVSLGDVVGLAAPTHITDRFCGIDDLGLQVALIAVAGARREALAFWVGIAGVRALGQAGVVHLPDPRALLHRNVLQALVASFLRGLLLLLDPGARGRQAEGLADGAAGRLAAALPALDPWLAHLAEDFWRAAFRGEGAHLVIGDREEPALVAAVLDARDFVRRVLECEAVLWRQGRFGLGLGLGLAVASRAGL